MLNDTISERTKCVHVHTTMFSSLVSVPKMRMKMSLYNVHYDQLKKDLLRQQKLWSDPNFPASKVSLGKLKHIREKIDWMRIKVCDN